MKPRLLMVGRTRYSIPLSETLARKFDTLASELDVRVLASAVRRNGANDPRFRLYPPLRPRRLDGALFYALLPLRVSRELREFRPDAVLVQGAQETALVLLARRLARVPTAVILDLHGDWHAPTRLYGSRFRRALAPLADALARLALRRADGVRTIGDYTERLVATSGVEVAASFPAYMDLDPFLGPPLKLPEQPTALFVGVLERYKGIDVLADAWRKAAPRLAGARLRLVGDGTMTAVVESLLADLPDQTCWDRRLVTKDVAAALDAATVLVLPSRSEGMGRVIVEAFCRSRGVVASRVGGIPDLVVDRETGVLVRADDADELAEALVRVLGDPELARRLGEAGRRGVEPWAAPPEEYARRMRLLVERVTA